MFLIAFCIGNFNGTLSKVPAADLGAITIKEVLNRGNTNATDVDEVIMGQVKMKASHYRALCLCIIIFVVLTDFLCCNNKQINRL